MKKIAFLILTVSAQSCLAIENCDNPETQQEMNYCSGTKLINLEKKLEKKVNSISKILNTKKSKELLLSSNTAWFKYRDSHCESTSHMYDGGSIHRFIEYECKSMITEIRIESIELDYADTINTILKGSP